MNKNKKYTYATITYKQWETILSSELSNKAFFDILLTIYNSEKYRLNASIIAEILGYKHFVPLNSIIGQLGHKIYNVLDLTDAPTRENGEVRWWNIIFDGEDVYKGNKLVRCDWIIKEQMLIAIKNLGLFSENRKHCAVDLKNKKIYSVLKDSKNLDNLTGKERKAIVKVRLNQGRIRKNALKVYDGCAVCGMKVPELLIASHIKSWANSNPDEKGDINNILLLCPNHDALFDKHLISFNDNGDILINKEIRQEDREKLNINESMKIVISEKMKCYMKHHREIFYKSDKKE